jgi:outer membrane scaffolding protein for murein synthesis (MipA/OmpV family)
MLILKILTFLKNILSFKNKSVTLQLLSMFLLTVTLSKSVIAFDGGSELNLGPNTPIVKDEFEWQVIVDFSLAYQPMLLKDIEQEDLLSFIQLGLFVDLSYKGFFLHKNQRRSSTLLDSIELGYQLSIQENWQLDIITKAYLKGFSSDSLTSYKYSGVDLLSGLKERNSTAGIALRYSHFFEDAIFTIDIAQTYSGSDQDGKPVSGMIIDGFYSYLLPQRNWDIYLGAGLTYYQNDIVNYYYGVDSNEANAIRPEFNADSAFRAQLEVYAIYPLSASWSFDAGITQTFYSSNIKDSPLVDKNVMTQVMAGVQYVF